MKIKHWQGYGTVNAIKINDPSCTLHIRVIGNHEWGIHRDDAYDLYTWLVRKFDNNYKNAVEWLDLHPQIKIIDGMTNNEETCDYFFTYPGP